MDGVASYDGSSRFLQWWPRFLPLAALVLLVSGGLAAVQWATFLVVGAWAHGRFVPYRFGVFDEGIVLMFPFGRRVFLPKSTTTVRLEFVGAVAVAQGHRHLGYPMHDGLLYVPDQRTRLQRALSFYGYRVV